MTLEERGQTVEGSWSRELLSEARDWSRSGPIREVTDLAPGGEGSWDREWESVCSWGVEEEWSEAPDWSRGGPIR